MLNSNKNYTPAGIGYVISNNKYPDYIRNHEVWKKLDKVKKVFPSIGLPNMQEDCAFAASNEARQEAINLLYSDIATKIHALYTNGYNALPKAYGSMLYLLYCEIVGNYNRMIVVEEGRIVLKFYQACGIMDNKYTIKAGEGVFRVYNKIIEKCKEYGLATVPLDDLIYFKRFSAVNVPENKSFKVVFSSTGAEGLWDISTISMRGISSCQSWGSTNSRGLIGSMSSRYVGVIYITSGAKYCEHGSQMLRRSLVRYCINKVHKKAALLVDRVYPTDDAAARKIFKDFLHAKSKLPVLFPGDPDWAQYRLPPDSYWKTTQLATNEFTYMDTKIPWIEPKTKTTKDYATYIARIQHLDGNIRSAVHHSIVSLMNEYCTNKRNSRGKSSGNGVHFRGGVVNLLLSINKHHGGWYAAHILPNLHARITSDPKAPVTTDCDSADHYEKKIIRHIYSQSSEIEFWMKSNAKIQLGKFTKFYTRSIDKYIKLVMREFRRELATRYKILCQNS